MKPTPPTNEAHAAIQAATQRADRTLTSAIAAERVDGVRSAQVEIEQLTVAEVTRLESQITAAREAARVAAEQVAARAEQTRLERADAIAKQLFSADKDALPALIHEFRCEPTRRTAVACREVWDRLDAIAVTELGEQLSEHVFGALVVADVLADPVNTNAISVFGAGIGYDDAGSTHEAVYAFVRKATTPAELQETLEAADLAITKRAARARSHGSPPSSFHHERLAVRRSHVTTRDLVRAFEQIDKRQAAATQAEFERTYQPPSPEAEFRRERLARIQGAAQR